MQSTFAHRQDGDGLWHSFCVICLKTVAESPSEESLENGEREHICSGPPFGNLEHEPKPNGESPVAF